MEKLAPVNFGIIGCGRVSARHIDALRNNVSGASIVAVCDIDTDVAKRHGELLGVPYFTTATEMYEAIDLDVVDIATPSGDHFDRAMEALTYGKHVVVEKPLALRLNQAERLGDYADKQGLKLWVAHQNRYNPAMVKAKEVFDSGRLGKNVVATVRVRWCREQDYYDADDWHGTWAMDGGVLSQQAIHHIDALQWFMGEPECVESLCATQLVSMECEDLCVATLKFKNGALGIIEAMTAARPNDFEASLSILGEKGTIILGGIAMNKIETWSFVDTQPDDESIPDQFSCEVPNAYGFGHNVLFNNVVSSIREEATVEIPASEGKKALEILHAVYASHEIGKRVYFDDKPISNKLGIRVGETGVSSEESIEAIKELVTNDLSLLDSSQMFAGIIGDNPSQYAKSPSIWNYTFKKLGIDSYYHSFDVEPENLAKLVDALRACPTFMGGSVTVPYKIAILDLLDEVDPKAKMIGAVNTLVRSPDGKLTGYNSDGQGGIDALLKAQPNCPEPFIESLEGMTVLMIGAGGAARATGFNLADQIGDKGRLAIINRTGESAQTLAEAINSEFGNTSFYPFSELKNVAKSSQLIVNCTSCGQYGVRRSETNQGYTVEPYSPFALANPTMVDTDESIPTGELFKASVTGSIEDIAGNNQSSFDLLLGLPDGVKYFDIVYSPLETLAMKQAKLCGIPTINGKAMNVGQAADSMFNRLFKDYFEARGLYDNATYEKIVEAMYEIW